MTQTIETAKTVQSMRATQPTETTQVPCQVLRQVQQNRITLLPMQLNAMETYQYRTPANAIECQGDTTTSSMDIDGSTLVSYFLEHFGLRLLNSTLYTTTASHPNLFVRQAAKNAGHLYCMRLSPLSKTLTQKLYS